MSPLAAAAVELVYREADLLDRREWAQWLDLYTEDCQYWAPAWIDEDRMTDDPQRQISLIAYTFREGLEDRVQRITSGRSLASDPLPRTIHSVSNPIVREEDGMIVIRTVWGVDSYDLRTDKTTRLFGRYEHKIVGDTKDNLKIASKYIEVMHARLPSIIDIYSI